MGKKLDFIEVDEIIEGEMFIIFVGQYILWDDVNFEIKLFNDI